MTTRNGIAPYTTRVKGYLVSFLRRKVKMFDLWGIEFFLNSSVLAIPIILAVSGNFNWRVGVYVLGVAVSILLHEMGHALGGYLTGNPAKEISLIAYGGYTVFSRSPGVTAKDAFMSLAGPMANGFVCSLLIWIESVLWGGMFGEWAYLLLSQVLGNDLPMDELPWSFVMMNAIAIVNAYMLVFNLLPAFPLDGGRIFRWLSRCCMSSQKAAFMTMFVARLLACLIVGQSIMTDLIVEFNLFNLVIMVLIAVWIWWGSEAELWRTRLYCAAEAGSSAAIAEIRRLFHEDVEPVIHRRRWR